MTIYLVRHGQTDDNVKNKMQGWRDTPLNNHGREQAKNLIPFFKTTNVDIIYASDLSRARETATIIGQELNLCIFEDKHLREMYLGDWEGQSWQEIEAKYAYFLNKPENEKNAINIHQGESYTEFQQRCEKSFKKLVKRHIGHDMMIVTHGGYIREVVAQIIRINQYQKDAIPIRNCSVSVIEYTPDNDHFHVIDLCVL